MKLICSSSSKKSLHHFLSVDSESRLAGCNDSHTSAVTAPCGLPSVSPTVFHTLSFWGLELVRDKAGRLGLKISAIKASPENV